MTVSAEWSTLILVVTCKSSTTAQETIILLLELPSKRFRLSVWPKGKRSNDLFSPLCFATLAFPTLPFPRSLSLCICPALLGETIKSTSNWEGELCKQRDDEHKLRLPLLSQNSPGGFQDTHQCLRVCFLSVWVSYVTILMSPSFFTALEAQILSKYNINRVDFVLLEQLVLVQQPYKAGMPWQFAGSFYYATTVLTTIGKSGRPIQGISKR